MFLSFKSENERKEYRGSTYIELQYCKLKPNAKLKKIVSLRSIKHWQDDSLYVNDIDNFCLIYGDMFCNGVYNNLKSGAIDLFGINYYSSILLQDIINKIEANKPLDYEVILPWLKQGLKYNGIYILGL